MPADPPQKSDLLARFAALRGDGLAFWRDFEPDRFWSRHGGAWSPADNVRHLMMSTAPVARALRLPRLVLRVMFGAAPEPARTWHAFRAAYLDGLGRGASAGRFAPPPVATPADPAAGQRQLIGECETTVRALGRAIEPWGEEDLDRLRLPHPVLGRLPLREMLMFTLFHFEHHRDRVAERLGGPEPRA